MVRSVNSMPVFTTVKYHQAVTPQNSAMNFKGEKKLATNSVKDPNKIGYWRATFSRLTDKQIANINETGQLTGKVKFKNVLGRYGIVPNLLNVTTGTKTLPAGYEVKKNWLGFTLVLPKDSEGAFIEKNKTPKVT